MEHHSLDVYPVPREKTPMYINEPWLIDRSLLSEQVQREPEEKEDSLIINMSVTTLEWGRF